MGNGRRGTGPSTRGTPERTQGGETKKDVSAGDRSRKIITWVHETTVERGVNLQWRETRTPSKRSKTDKVRDETGVSDLIIGRVPISGPLWIT